MDMRMILMNVPFFVSEALADDLHFPPIPIFIFVIGLSLFFHLSLVMSLTSRFSRNLPFNTTTFVCFCLSHRLVYQGHCLPPMKRGMKHFYPYYLTCVFLIFLYVQLLSGLANNVCLFAQ